MPVRTFMKATVQTVDPRDTPDELFELLSIPAYDAGKPEVVRGAEIGSQKKCVFPGDVLLSRIIPHIRRAWVVSKESGRRPIASTEWIVFSGEEVLPGYLRHIFLSDAFHVRFMRTITGVGGSLQRANPTAVGEIEIPVPPLAEQERFVAELEAYRKIIEAARQILAAYRPTFSIDPNWPRVKLATVCSQEKSVASSKAEKSLPYLGLENVEGGTGRILLESSNPQEAISTSFVFDEHHVLYGKLRPYLNKVAMPDFSGRCTTELIPLLPSKKLERGFLFWLLLRPETVQVAMNGKTGARMPRADMGVLLAMEIPLPTIEVQRQIVAELESERSLVEANRELIARFEKKMQAKLAEIWGELAEPVK
jgi:hypothetical protein